MGRFSRELTGGMEGCPMPRTQTCTQPSNCRGNVYNECEKNVFIALCVFFTNLFLAIVLLYLVLVDGIKYCKNRTHRMYSIASDLLNVSIAVYLTVGLTDASGNFKFMYGNTTVQSRFYIVELEERAQMLVTQIALPAFLISMVGNGILQAFVCYGDRVAQLAADISRGRGERERILVRLGCCESARGVLVYQSVHAFLLLFLLVIIVMFLECAPPVLACVAFGVSLLISIFLLVKLLPTRMITQAHEQQNGSDEIREPLQRGIVLPDIALFFLHSINNTAIIVGVYSSIDKSSASCSKNRNTLVVLSSCLVGFNMIIVWYSFMRLTTARIVYLMYFYVYGGASVSRQLRNRVNRNVVQLYNIDLKMIEENMPKYQYDVDQHGFNGKKNCPICLEALDGKFVRTLTCGKPSIDGTSHDKMKNKLLGHTFCSNCIDSWFLMDSNSIEHQSCPLCKSKLIWDFKLPHTRNLNANYVCQDRQGDEEDGDDLELISLQIASSSEGDGGGD